MRAVDITPKAHRCAVGCCPGIFRTDRGTILVVGRKLAREPIDGLPTGRIGPDEEVVEIPEAILDTCTRE